MSNPQLERVLAMARRGRDQEATEPMPNKERSMKFNLTHIPENVSCDPPSASYLLRIETDNHEGTEHDLRNVIGGYLNKLQFKARDAHPAAPPTTSPVKDYFADLRGADLRGAYLRRADLRGADLRRANLEDADLWRADLQCANLEDANLRGADLRGAYLQCANLRGADLRCASIPVIPNIHKAVYAAASQPGALKMESWHTCEQTHCRAGWVVTLAGKEGLELENRLGTGPAAALIYYASDPQLEKVPSWVESNEGALADMKRLAEANA